MNPWPGGRPPFWEALCELLRTSARPAQPVEIVSRSGSDFHQTYRCRLDDGGPELFIKVPGQPGSDVLEAEADGLRALESAGALRVPGSRLFCRTSGILAMEFVETGPKTQSFEEQLGAGLAQTQKTSSSEAFGWHRDSYLGATRQVNSDAADWPAFFGACRLEPQIRMARDRGLSSSRLERSLGHILERLDERLATDEPPSLVHGDLWSGNALATQDREPIVIDPACSYSDRLFDLGMTRLFGGFSQRFYAAYHEAWPLPPEADDKIEHYTLYHLLNHLNLFGGSYLASCEAAATRLAGSFG